MSYDSRDDTLEHIKEVGENINLFLIKLLFRAVDHDKSKLKNPEKELFDIYTPLLKEVEYGSEEYYRHLQSMSSTALRHHYEHNRHHPEHFQFGVNDMSLIDLIEMMCDWKAACDRVKGDFQDTLDHNFDRFGVGDVLSNVLLSTARYLGWIT